jgi:hypothetical protein
MTTPRVLEPGLQRPMDIFEPDSRPLRDVEMADAELSFEQSSALPRHQSAERSHLPSPADQDEMERMTPEYSSLVGTVYSFYSMDVDPPKEIFGQGDNSGSQSVLNTTTDLDEDAPDDLVGRIPGMFRLLDLFGEEGCDGIGEYLP